MNPLTMNSAALITSHLNAPFGDVLCVQDLAESLSVGRLSAKTERANAVLGYLFVETEPRLIAACVQEVGSSMDNANRLYLETLDHQVPRCPLWERVFRGQL
jgi:hypothetical protein